MQRSSEQPLVGEERYVTTLITAAKETISLHRDLGLLTSDVLSRNFHIANITAKANSILGLIKGTCRDVNDVTTLKVVL